MALKLSNNASSTLAGSITATSTSLSVASDDAGKFPALSEGDWFPVTIVDSAGNLEILKATARTGAILTVERGQEGTTATSFDAGARVELRLTAAAMMAFLPEEAKAADSAKLNGEEASYYTDITARLGYTPLDKAGGNVSGDLSVTGTLKHGDNEVWDKGNFDPDGKLDATAQAADSAKLDGNASSEYATSEEGALARSAVQPDDLGEAATANIGTTSGTVAAGDDSRIVNAATKDGSNATGTWPINITGNAATATTADNALGVGQTWQDVTASRVLETVYQNTTGRSIGVMLWASSANIEIDVSSDASTWVSVACGSGGSGNTGCGLAIVTSGYYYRIHRSGGAQSIGKVVELR